MSEAEFDDISDDLVNNDNIDWDTLLSAPGALSLPPTGTTVRSPAVASTPSHYYSGDEELGDDILEQLDVMEANYQATLSRPGVPQLPHSEESTGGPVSALNLTFGNLTSLDTRNIPPNPAEHLPCPSPSSKRLRSRSTSPQPLKKGKMKSESRNRVQQVVLEYEGELTCPICHDLFVAAQVGNPCGHSVCGDCGWEWFAKKKIGECAVCRANLSKKTPFIPNISVDSLVDKYIQMQKHNGDTEWNNEGSKYKELNERKQHWKDGATERALRRGRHRKRKKSSSIEFVVI